MTSVLPADGLDGLLGYVPVVVGVLFTVVGVLDVLRTVPGLRRSVRTQGVVVEAHEKSSGESTAWRLTVAYRDAAGQDQQARWHGDSSADRTRYVPGMPVPVRYDPRRPDRVWLPGGGRVHPLLVPGVFMVIGPAVVVGWLLLR